MRKYTLFVAFVIALIIATNCVADVTVFQDWSTASQFIIGWRTFPLGGNIGVDHYNCGVRFYVGSSYPVEADFYLAWIKNLSAGDVVQFIGAGCSSPYRFSEFWTYNCDQIVHDAPCTTYDTVPGNELDNRSYIVPANACGLVICARNPNSNYNIIDWFEITVPDHAVVVMPDYILYPVFDKPIFTDVPNDQGGQISVAWNNHYRDAASASVPVVEYDVQRLSSNWETIVTVAAVQADSYSVTVPTEDILILEQPAPYSQYRIIARTVDLIEYPSLSDSCYSIDNLPPDSPVLEIFDSLTSRFIVWQNPDVADFDETCIFRGTEPEFIPDTPLECSTTSYFIESHLNRFWYKARSFDIHGNASEWSNEVVGQYPTGVPGAMPTVLRLYPNQPNPFNPQTTIKYDVPDGGRVTLRVYDVSGALVRTLVDADLPRGSHQVTWDGRDSSGRGMASGSYFARLETGGIVDTVRMSFVK